jgi:3'(2'),5'-bisphosphate nucleotidase
MVVDIHVLEALCDIAMAAAHEIMSVYHVGGNVWRKDDRSPLTEADLRADRVIRQGLEARFPGMFILSEESVSAAGHCAASETFFLVDPLDGTKEFLKRNDEFTVNIALIADGEPVAGVVLAPALGEMFYAAHGLGAYKQDAQGVHAIQTARYEKNALLRVIGSRSHGGDEMSDWLASLSEAHTFIAAGSSLKFCRVAEGLADVYPRFGPTSQWDTAAAHAILQMAGGAVVDLQGETLRYGRDREILNPYFAAVGQKELLSLFYEWQSL